MTASVDHTTGMVAISSQAYTDELALRAALPTPPARIAFVNDASAFAIGEWIGGAAQGAGRVVGITLGSGVGSAFLDHGHVISEGPDVPPSGYAHLLRINGRPLEGVVSRRAIIAAYQSATGSGAAGTPAVDVDTIAHRAADGDSVARSVFDRAIGTLGDALRPWLIRFDAGVLVVGGGMAESWEIIEPPLRDSLLRADTAPGAPWKGGTIVRSRDTEESNLVGAAWHALNARTDMPADRSA